MKALKRFFKIAVLVLSAVLVSGFLNFALVPVSYARWVNNDIENNASELNTAFFGSSTVFCSIDPQLFDEKTGDTVAINCGSASQKMMDSYYYLLDTAACCSNLENVFLDVYPLSFMKAEGNEAADLQRKMALINRYKNPLLKYEYIAKAFSLDDIYYGLLPFTYYNNNITLSVENIKSKLSDDYRSCSYDYDGFVEKYEGMGYIPYRYDPVGDLSLDPAINLSKEHDPQAFEYLGKIIEFCEEKDINLFFMEMPISQRAYEQEEPYAVSIRNEIRKIAEDKNVPYINLNELVENKILTDSDFYVAEHLNINGSKKVTEVLADFYKDSVS